MSSTPPTQPVQVHTKKSGLASATIAKLVILGVILLIILIFILQNTEKVHFDFLFWGFSMSLWIMFVITLVVGVLLGMAVSAMLRVRKRKELKRKAHAI
jgi:uncharacterized integral membrane protein